MPDSAPPAAWSSPRYAFDRTYQWNYDHPPAVPEGVRAAAMGGGWTFCGRPVPSPLGVAAGPLLNGQWCLFYAALGLDVVTYKTVRSQARGCYPLPNLAPVDCGPLDGSQEEVPQADQMRPSWAVSYGMPSQPPEVWRADVRRTRQLLPPDKLLSVSVVATVDDQATVDDMAADYALCARWAVDSGADAVEANFSCPNVATGDGQLYQQPQAAGRVAREIRRALPDTPLLLKIGHLTDEAAAAAVAEAVAPWADALSMTNSVAARVRGADGRLMFDGQPRGICGRACRDASLRQVELMRGLIERRQAPLRIIGVGGIAEAADVRAYLDAGAEAVQLATAVMQNPAAALEIRQRWEGD